MKNYAATGTCRLCGQGRLIIAKDTGSGELFVFCEDCESEWETPEATKDIHISTQGADVRFVLLERGDAAGRGRRLGVRLIRSPLRGLIEASLRVGGAGEGDVWPRELVVVVQRTSLRGFSEDQRSEFGRLAERLESIGRLGTWITEILEVLQR